MQVLLGDANAPQDPILIYGVRAATVSLLAPVLANDLAVHVRSRVQVAAAADILWGDDAAEATWSRLLN